MTTKINRRQLTMSFAVAAPAHWSAVSAWAFAPGEFWDEKNPSDWTDKDIQKLMTKSPWAKQVTASMDMSAMGGRMGGGAGGGRRGGGGGGMGGGMPGGGMSGGGGFGGGGGMEGGGPGGGGGMAGGGGMGGPGGGGGMGGPPEIKALVRWETATPVCEAAKRQPTSESEGHYIISLNGVPVMGGRGGQGRNPNEPPTATPDPAARQAAMEERRKAMQERLKTSTMLQRKGKDPIYPDRVEVSAERRIFIFFFPHTSDPIQAADKDVTFFTKMGPIEVKTKFSLKDMIYKGELAL